MADTMTLETTRAIEAILMVAERPVETRLLAEVLELPRDQVDQAVRELSASYDVDGRGFVLIEVAGGWRYQSHPDLAPYVERFVLDGQAARLSAAALETLAIVAYKQPISRAQIAAIRGVNVDGVIRTLEQRGYIAEVDRDPGPGNASLVGTTTLFLERLGLRAIGDLPPIAQFLPGAEVVEALEAGLRAEPDTETGDAESDTAPSIEADVGDAGDGDAVPSAQEGATEPTS